MRRKRKKKNLIQTINHADVYGMLCKIYISQVYQQMTIVLFKIPEYKMTIISCQRAFEIPEYQMTIILCQRAFEIPEYQMTIISCQRPFEIHVPDSFFVLIVV